MNPVLHAIRVWGPYKLVSLLRENGWEALLPKEYIRDCICDVCYKLLSDERIVSALTDFLQDEQTRRAIAYGRVYYLKEATMAERYGLMDPDNFDRQEAEPPPGAESSTPVIQRRRGSSPRRSTI